MSQPNAPNTPDYIPISSTIRQFILDPLPMVNPYQQGNTNQYNGRDVARLNQEPAVCQASYEFDSISNTWCLLKFTNGRLKKKIPLIGNFSIGIVQIIYDAATDQLVYVIVNYYTQGSSYYSIMMRKDFCAQSFVKHLPFIQICPECTNAQANALLNSLIQNAPTEKFQLFPRQGFMQLADKSVTFGFCPESKNFPDVILPESLKKRTLPNVTRAPGDIIDDWNALYGSNAKLKLIGLLRIASLFLFYLYAEKLYPNLLLLIKPSTEVGSEQLKAMLSTNNCWDYPLPNLDCGLKKLQQERSQIWDGVALILDRSFADEAAKIEEPLRYLMKTARGDDSAPKSGRHLIAVISEYAAYTAYRIGADNVLPLSMDGATLCADIQKIRRITQEMDALMIRTALQSVEQTKHIIANVCQKLRLESANDSAQSCVAATQLVYVSGELLREFFGIRIVSMDEAEDLVATIMKTCNAVRDASQAILNDFSTVLSDLFRISVFSAVQKRNQMRIDPNGQSAIIAGNRLYISSEMLSEVLSQMRTTHNQKSLIDALKRSDILIATDGDTHPIDTHDLNGKHLRLYWYDISAEILDTDVLHHLTNLENAAFWQSVGNEPQDFVALLNDGSGNAAGTQIRYQDAENGSCYITGQSGYGKTYLLSQLIAKHHALGHQIVVFDSSDSFTYEAMCRNLSKEYVDRNVTFHDIDRNGIPIDLFYIDRSANLPSQKKELLGILTAGIGEQTAPQSNTLRSVLSDMLSMIDKDESIRTADILAMLDEDGTTYKSIRNRLTPLFEDIDACRMSAKPWGDCLQDAGKIVVIHTESDFTEKSSRIIDMLLTSLFNYQRGNLDIPLDIFMDEVQNQNFSAISPIRKILKEGRKFHLSFFGATQDYYARSTDHGSVMGKAGTQIFLRPTQNCEIAVASELRFGKADMARFDTMQRGDIIVKGSFYHCEQERNVPAILSGRTDSFIKPQ